MAVTSITITQDNKLGDVNLLAAHSPLVFIAKVEWNTNVPDYIIAEVSGIEYKCVYLTDNSPTERSFYFVADEIFRSNMELLTDNVQSNNTLISILELTDTTTITFKDIDDTVSASVEIIPTHAARSFEDKNGQTLVDLYNNEPNTYLSVGDNQFYLYWYNDDESNVIAEPVVGSSNSIFTLEFGANISAGESIVVFFYRQYPEDAFAVNYLNSDTISEINLQEGVQFSAGATLDDSLNNLLPVLQGQANLNNFTITKTSTAIVMEDTSGYYSYVVALGTNITENVQNNIGTFAFLQTIFQSLNSYPPGTEISFTIDGSAYPMFTTNSAPTATTEFQIGANNTATAQEYLTRLILAYPTLDNIIQYEPASSDRNYIMAKDVNDSFSLLIDGFSAVLQASGNVPPSQSIQPGAPQQFRDGFLRKKIDINQVGYNTLYINGVPYTHNMINRDECSGDLLVRYLDRNGQYRFFGFSKFYQQEVKPEVIGDVEELILSLKDDSGDKRRIGYNNNNRITASLQNANEIELNLLSQMYNSRDVSLYMNNKWITVFVKGDNVTKAGRFKFKDVSVNFELPKNYNITEL